MRKVIIDTPLMELTLRRYEKPDNLNLRELLKKFCLSMGLLQPGDSRDIIVDILHVLLIAKKKERHLSSEDIKNNVVDMRTNNNLPLIGVASSNVRRQIKRLRDILIVEKVKNNYRIIEFAKLHDTFEEKIGQYLLPTILTRVKEYCKVIDEEFHPNPKINAEPSNSSQILA
jgi:hypothetical protein